MLFFYYLNYARVFSIFKTFLLRIVYPQEILTRKIQGGYQKPQHLHTLLHNYLHRLSRV
jgi:hypothetical protein